MARSIALIVTLGIPVWSLAQWTETFSGSFPANWQGDTTDFQIDANGQLQLNAVDAGTSWISHPVDLSAYSEVEWRFVLELPFSPSSSNNARIYLSVDGDSLDGNGYFLQFGEALSNDAIELFRQDATGLLSVCRGPDGQIAGAFRFGVRVTRDRYAVWRLYVDSLTGNGFKFLSLGAEGSYSVSSHLGIQCTYTSSNATRFFFDDFYAGPLDTDSVVVEPVAIHSIVFNEIYFEPASSSVLPYAEFVECYNRSGDTMDMSGWTISDGTTVGRLPGGSRLLPGQYAIICDEDDASLFEPYGLVMSVSSLPSLNNDVGDHLELKDATGRVMDVLEFSDLSYHNPSKKNGGWTIERIDPSFMCSSLDNWIASENVSGGTPGRTNSVMGVFRDEKAPWVSHGWVEDPRHIRIKFSEPIILQSMESVVDWKDATGSVITMDTVAYVDAQTVTFTSPDSIAAWPVYGDIDLGITDCPGNAAEPQRIYISVPDYPDSSDVVINELLFDAPDGIADFVECYNRSARVIDMKDFMIGETDFDGQSISTAPKVVTKEHFLLFPGRYVVFTEDDRALASYFSHSDHRVVIRSDELPDFNTTEGGVRLFAPDGSVMDEMRYQASWHYPLLADVKGVTLERIDANVAGTVSSTWHSAASVVGYGTPGCTNSQTPVEAAASGELEVRYDIVTPDNDGIDDVLILDYRFETGDRLAFGRVFSERGLQVRELLNHETLSTNGQLLWDARDDSGSLVAAGKYIVMLETIDPRGKTRRFRKAFGVFYP